LQDINVIIHQLKKGVTMKPRQVLLLAVLAGILAVVGCTPYQQTLTADEKSYAVTNADSIKVYLPDEEPSRAYREIGAVIVEKGDAQEAVSFMKENAARMGANAIVDCEVRVVRHLSFLIFYDNKYIASGTAVVYQDAAVKGAGS
jgi:hypothetical protein